MPPCHHNEVRRFVSGTNLPKGRVAWTNLQRLSFTRPTSLPEVILPYETHLERSSSQGRQWGGGRLPGAPLLTASFLAMGPKEAASPHPVDSSRSSGTHAENGSNPSLLSSLLRCAGATTPRHADDHPTASRDAGNGAPTAVLRPLARPASRGGRLLLAALSQALAFQSLPCPDRPGMSSRRPESFPG
jgi:hypothetical protein